MNQSPDTTARLLRSLLQAAPNVTAGGQMRFLWPAPPHYEFLLGSDQGSEDCVLLFRDGTKAAGKLIRFQPDEMLLNFQPEEAASSTTVTFASLQWVQLLRALPVKRQAQGSGDAAPGEFPLWERQPFSVPSGGKTIEGETIGTIHALCGMFLFLPEANHHVLRCFVPAQAALAASVGKPIGQLLVERKLASPELVNAALKKQLEMRSRRLGEYLTSNQIVSQAQLAAALKQQRAQPVRKLGETLVELGFLSPEELAEALAVERQNRTIPLGQILTQMGVVDADMIQNVMAAKLGIPFVNLRALEPRPEALKRVPAAVAWRYQVVPVAEADSGLVIAVDDPMNSSKLEELRFIAGTKLSPVMASIDDIRYALERCYGPPVAAEAAAAGAELDVGIEQLTDRLAAESDEVDANEQQVAQSDTTLVRLVNKLILDAVAQKASDIHIEANPSGRTTRIRFRKDGALVNYLELAAKFRKAVISRIKIMSQLDITEHRKPQDGKIEFRRFGPLDVELRVATVPTAGGLEDVVMRVLTAATLVPIDKLGFDAEALASLKRLISRPHGMFLVCGPTGSGKTTTLHSLLGFLNTAELKIWTAEDPIEITQAGLRQVQVHPKIGWTFAAAMRSFMRADPDVIMVGEMRDEETARIGVEASLTGHLVFSTLHTNSAVESVVRLLDLGMDSFNFADALIGVLSQRLVRTLCPACRVADQPQPEELEALALEYCADTGLDAKAVLKEWRKGSLALHRAKGCAECDKTGYKGRIALFELLVADAPLKRLVQTRAPVPELAAAAMKGGMRTLKQDGIAKVLQGLTDISQVRMVAA